MSNRWRIVNPALNPPQVAFESDDEQAALREYAAREGYLRELHKSEDEGQTWAVVEARAPDGPKAAAKVEKSDDSRELERGELGGSSGASEHAERSSTKHRR
jgi:hypothetical protein